MSNSVLSPEPASDALKCSASTRTHWVRKPDWALAAVLLVLQALSGAYRGDFDANEDEAAHVVSSLMVHDYLVSGKMAHPWRFATDYYVHYPKVAILHWPPLFYSSEAMWMFATSRSRAGLLSFQAVLASTLVIGLFFWMRREHGLWISFVAALVMASNRTMMAAAVEVWAGPQPRGERRVGVHDSDGCARPRSGSYYGSCYHAAFGARHQEKNRGCRRYGAGLYVRACPHRAGLSIFAR